MNENVQPRIDKIHESNGIIIDKMNNGEYSVLEAKELLNFNAKRIERMKSMQEAMAMDPDAPSIMFFADDKAMFYEIEPDWENMTKDKTE